MTQKPPSREEFFSVAIGFLDSLSTMRKNYGSAYIKIDYLIDKAFEFIADYECGRAEFPEEYSLDQYVFGVSNLLSLIELELEADEEDEERKSVPLMYDDDRKDER